MKKQLFLDCDGVLADFDSYFESQFGSTSAEYEAQQGSKDFWQTIRAHDDFFYKLPLMPDAVELYEHVKAYRPIILTGVPFGNWATPQKLRWRDKHFPGTPMVTCSSKDKRLYCQPGDVLLDDLEKYKHLWESAGGIFILHTSADNSIKQFEELLW